LTTDRKGNLKELRWIGSFGLWGYDGRELPLQTAATSITWARDLTPRAGPTVLAELIPNETHAAGRPVHSPDQPRAGLKQAGTALVTTGPSAGPGPLGSLMRMPMAHR